MTDGCDLSKYRLFIKHLENRPKVEMVVVITAAIVVVALTYFVGRGVQEGAKILTEKAISTYLPQEK